MSEAESTKSIRLILDSNLADVFLVGLAIRGICSYVPLGDVMAYQAELCIVEAVNNAIRHAYGNEAGHDVEIDVAIHLDRIAFEVCDTGPGMGPQASKSEPFDPGDLENIPEGGMGLAIIHSAMDEVAYVRTGRKNTLRMCKYFDPSRRSREMGTPP